MIFVIDNYDSFTYNIVHYLGELGAEMVIKRNDMVTVDDIITMAPSHLLVSPGPCSPTEAGISVEAITRCAGTTNARKDQSDPPFGHWCV